MMSKRSFDDLVNEIMALGLSEERACRYAACIGDTPEMDGDRVVVRDEHHQVVATLRLESFVKH